MFDPRTWELGISSFFFKGVKEGERERERWIGEREEWEWEWE